MGHFIICILFCSANNMKYTIPTTTNYSNTVKHNKVMEHYNNYKGLYYVYKQYSIFTHSAQIQLIYKAHAHSNDVYLSGWHGSPALPHHLTNWMNALTTCPFLLFFLLSIFLLVTTFFSHFYLFIKWMEKYNKNNITINIVTIWNKNKLYKMYKLSSFYKG